ncbi:recombinase family protein [Nocardioides massiliensis]|uniref:DNA invertase Pin-like site-specific DNA recombinase n=1 Tax=Nocardioides massiliensis TaxID=1325935 RepID=A0ABT9NLX0_9ACTN|nr:recombinase family protein [Nocardioides massiliensis]MDP9821040.1 DNA invertase Pin-like site-specific DNA recombinase [Nocardioides massiliensis]
MKYGYLRVSTGEQSLDQQESQLRRLGVEVFVREKVSGRRKPRPQLEAMLGELRTGDELHITKLDRLGRDITELHGLARTLEDKGVALVIGGQRHDPHDPTGKLFFGMLALFAEFEADLVAARTRERLAELRAQGKATGKPRVLSDRQASALLNAHEAGESIAALTHRLGVSRSTVRRTLDRERVRRALRDSPGLRRQVRELEAEREKALRDLDKAMAERGDDDAAQK